MELLHLLSAALAVVTLAQAAETSSHRATTPRRERNLDHLDPDTLSYYVGLDASTFEPLKDSRDIGFDVAVLFYAQWDQNSHALAPYWDKIATIVKAGSKQSKLIMGLFNCELDIRNMQLCSAVGISHYPTLEFIGTPPFHDGEGGLGAILGKKSKDVLSLPNVVKFRGNWVYTDSVLDWIRAMQGLSNWNRMGFFKTLRKRLFGFLGKPASKPAESLPIGIPEDGGSFIAGSKLLALETQFEMLKNTSTELEKLAAHASVLLDSLLFPVTDMDAFTFLKESDGWNATNKDPSLQVMRSCVSELSLDYCSRLSTHATNEFLDTLNFTQSYPSFQEIEKMLLSQINETEPYCAIYDTCLRDDFAPSECQPAACPFVEKVACLYMKSCFSNNIQQEYARALGLIKEGEKFAPEQKAIEHKSQMADDTLKKPGVGWGISTG